MSYLDRLLARSLRPAAFAPHRPGRFDGEHHAPAFVEVDVPKSVDAETVAPPSSAPGAPLRKQEGRPSIGAHPFVEPPSSQPAVAPHHSEDEPAGAASDGAGAVSPRWSDGRRPSAGTDTGEPVAPRRVPAASSDPGPATETGPAVFVEKVERAGAGTGERIVRDPGDPEPPAESTTAPKRTADDPGRADADAASPAAPGQSNALEPVQRVEREVAAPRHAEAPVPTVRVTIGRVVVRAPASPPARAARTTAAPSRRPAMSLDAYLRRADGR